MRFESASMIAAAVVAGLLGGCSSTKTVEPAKEAAKAPQPKTRPVAPPAGDPHWGYEAAEGPSSWGKLSAKWAVCGDGRGQSPIDIERTKKADLPALKAEFKPAQLKIVHHEHMADVVNTGHSIQVNYTLGDKLKMGNESFELLQYHFHSPSEHTVGGKHYPMEMHMVHKSAEGKLAVVGVFIEEGAANAAFEPVWANLPKSRSVEHHLEHVTVDVNRMLPASTESYRYTGSLTTPPCSEGVKWVVMTTPVHMSATQIDDFRAIMKGNNRPPQPLNGRAVITDKIAEKVAPRGTQRSARGVRSRGRTT